MAEGTATWWDRYQVPVLVAGALILGLIARLVILGDSLVLDEGSTHYVVNDRGPREMLNLVRGEQEVTPPLFFMFAWFAQLLGDTPEILKIPSLVFGLATIPLTYVLGRMTVGRNPALVATFLVSLSPFMIFYSTVARPYALVTLMVLISSIALVKALTGDRTVWWVVFAAACAGTMYTHYTGLFILLGQFAWAFVFFADRRKKLLLAGVGAAILFLPWLGEYRADSESPGAEVIGSIFPFEFSAVPRTLAGWSFDYPLGDSLPVSGYLFGYLILAGVLIGLVGLLAKVARERDWIPNRMLLLPVVLALSAPVGTIVYSAFSVSVFLQRNLATSTVGLALVIGAIVMAPSKRQVRWAAATVVLAAVGVTAVLSLDREQRRLDYQGAVDYMVSRSQGGPAVIVEAADSVPAPESAVDIVQGQKGTDLPVLRLDRPTADEQASLLNPDGPGRFTKLPIPETETIVDESLELAGDGEIYVISPSLGKLGDTAIFSPLMQDFEETIGDRANLVGEKVFSGNPAGLLVQTYEPTGENPDGG